MSSTSDTYRSAELCGCGADQACPCTPRGTTADSEPDPVIAVQQRSRFYTD